MHCVYSSTWWILPNLLLWATESTQISAVATSCSSEDKYQEFAEILHNLTRPPLHCKLFKIWSKHHFRALYEISTPMNACRGWKCVRFKFTINYGWIFYFAKTRWNNFSCSSVMNQSLSNPNMETKLLNPPEWSNNVHLVFSLLPTQPVVSLAKH